MRTEIVNWDPARGYREEDLDRAAGILRSGGLVAFPTETVYGLGGDGLRPEASRKIYAAKGRPSDNPLILHISERRELDALVAGVSEMAEKLMAAFWPGPMTLIFDKAPIVPYETTGGLDTVAVRMPSHEGARELIRRAGVPVAAPSANTSGKPSPTCAEHVREDLAGKIDMIIDGGSVGIGLESTIIDMTEEVPVILRPGHITEAMIREVIGEVRMDPGLVAQQEIRQESAQLSDEYRRHRNEGGQLQNGDIALHPKAPGMKYRHYAPKGTMTVYEGPIERVIARINELAAGLPADKVGILATDETRDKYPRGQVVSVGSREKRTIEQGLFGALRRFDELGVEFIFSESFFGEDRGEAIMNRLLKAAGQRVEHLPS